VFFLSLIQSMAKALNSEGRPGQVAAGIALGACLGLTPLMNLHNLVVLLLAMILDVSLAGFSLGWTVFVPVGFLLDPLFDLIGRTLLASPSLAPLWTRIANTPVLSLANLNNSVVLGSLVFWIVALFPIWLLARSGVTHYRARVYERLKKTRVFQAIQASNLYKVYRLFQP
jgi:uncharacterized protein (TIGR03546 family)